VALRWAVRKYEQPRAGVGFRNKREIQIAQEQRRLAWREVFEFGRDIVGGAWLDEDFPACGWVICSSSLPVGDIEYQH